MKKLNLIDKHKFFTLSFTILINSINILANDWQLTKFTKFTERTPTQQLSDNVKGANLQRFKDSFCTRLNQSQHIGLRSLVFGVDGKLTNLQSDPKPDFKHLIQQDPELSKNLQEVKRLASQELSRREDIDRNRQQYLVNHGLITTAIGIPSSITFLGMLADLCTNRNPGIFEGFTRTIIYPPMLIVTGIGIYFGVKSARKLPDIIDSQEKKQQISQVHEILKEYTPKKENQ